jgi:methylmalonyl-CoA/ethylmalonyl-CoA epimerase
MKSQGVLRHFKCHHMGIAVSDFDAALNFYEEALGFRLISGPFDDPIQRVKVGFMEKGGLNRFVIEIISPLDGSSPVNGYLAKGIGAYHTCYEVSELDTALSALRQQGCVVLSNPTPAVAFKGRQIAWCFTPTRHLIELVESEAHHI